MAEGKKRGGGPKTPEGKAAVRRNPIKHGVLAQTPVIPLVEREEDWRRRDCRGMRWRRRRKGKGGVAAQDDTRSDG